MIPRRNARPARIRLRLWDEAAPGAVRLALPARRMWLVGIIFAVTFVIFAAVDWAVIARLSSHSVDDIFDLVFVLFEGFWVLGWSVGVVLLGALTVLLFMYSESVRLQDRTLVHIPRLGPLAILVDYDLSNVRNVRLEEAGNKNADDVRVRFDYGDGTNTLGDSMPRFEGQRLVDVIAAAAASVSSIPEILRPAARPAETPAEVKPSAVPLPTTSVSALALIAANLFPLLGVLLLGWDIASIMVLFWVESGIIAFYTVLKIAVVGKLMALLAVPFFIGHFGAFMAIHFLLIYTFFLRGIDAGMSPGVGEALRVVFIPIWTSIAALFISHGISFVTNFIGRREYAGTTVTALMHAPYGRIVVMQLTLILGGWIVLLMKSSVGALVLLLVLKTAGDLRAHRKERNPPATRV